MSFTKLMPTDRRRLLGTLNVRIHRKYVRFSRAATRDIFADKDGFVEFFLDIEKRRLGVKPGGSTESGFPVHIYRKEKAPVAVVHPGEIMSKVVELVEGAKTLPLILDEKTGLYIAEIPE